MDTKITGKPRCRFKNCSPCGRRRTLLRPRSRRRRTHADESFPRHAHGGQSPDESYAAREAIARSSIGNFGGMLKGYRAEVGTAGWA
jgi:hypothetical protein